MFYNGDCFFLASSNSLCWHPWASHGWWGRGQSPQAVNLSSKWLGVSSLLPMGFAWAFLRCSWTRNPFMDILIWCLWSRFFLKKSFNFLVQHCLWTTVVWRIAALWRVLRLLAWNASSWLSTDAAVRNSSSKVSKGLPVLCLVCFNWFVFLLGFSQLTTRFWKAVHFNFQNFLVDRKHNQQTLSHFPQ